VNWRALLASPLGFLIGLSLGALGGGGSILAVPALVYGAGQSPKQATTTSLLLVAMTSSIGLMGHLRAGRVRVMSGIVFGAAGVGGSLLGSLWNRSVDPELLLLAFSLLMFVAAWAMWRRLNPRLRPRSESEENLSDVLAPRATEDPSPDRSTVRIDLSTVVKVTTAGTVVGLLTGFFGVGGGFVIVPALVLALRFPMNEAAATSLLVIIVNSVVSLATRFDSGTIEWDVVTPFLIASLFGVVVGTRLATTHDASVLQRAFIWLLVAVASYTAVRSGISLL
jgi:uncharacterized membrane protein YfcA